MRSQHIAEPEGQRARPAGKLHRPDIIEENGAFSGVIAVFRRAAPERSGAAPREKLVGGAGIAQGHPHSAAAAALTPRTNLSAA
jgi:hypothetical protein